MPFNIETSLEFQFEQAYFEGKQAFFEKMQGVTNEISNQAMFWAASKGHTEFLIELIDTFNLNPRATNEQGSGLLHLAASQGHTDLIIECVKTYKLDPHSTRESGYGLFHDAARSQNCDHFHRLILEFGVTVETLVKIRDFVYLDHLMMLLIQTALEFRYVMRSDNLLQDINHFFKEFPERYLSTILQWPLLDGLTPLHVACNNQDHTLAEFFIEQGSCYEGLDALLESEGAMTCYFVSLARHNIPSSEEAVLCFAPAITYMLSQTPLHPKDKEILMNGLIGGQLQAGPDPEISLKNVAMGTAESELQIKKTRQTILQYALSLGNKTIAARYTEMLAGEGQGLKGVFMGCVSEDSNDPTMSILFDVLDRLKQLNLSLVEIKEEAKPDKAFLPSKSLSDRRDNGSQENLSSNELGVKSRMANN